jgi:hypothetical protein
VLDPDLHLLNQVDEVRLGHSRHEFVSWPDIVEFALCGGSKKAKAVSKSSKQKQ